MKPVKQQTMFAVVDYCGNIWGSSIRYFRREAIKSALYDICGNSMTWAKAKKRYDLRVVKVSVTPCQPLQTTNEKCDDHA